MLIAVLSDTHGYLHYAEQVLKQLNGIDLLLHAGDFVSDARKLKKTLGCNILCVSGNCDFCAMEPKERIVEFEGVNILITHGHMYKVKYGYERLLKRAKEVSAKIVVFGHTHKSENVTIDNVLLLNPGSTVFPRDGGNYTYAILNIKDGKAESRICTIKSSRRLI
ncbi:MAG: metallophosphoesterase [Thermoanaerobacterales bacterium]|nr:metallophosphoesterase [Thermoanaerobacterales bacterium]